MRKTITTYRDLIEQLKRLSESQLDQRCVLLNDDERWEPHCLEIADQDLYDFAEREWCDPCLPKSELSGHETEVHVGVPKGTVSIICDL